MCYIGVKEVIQRCDRGVIEVSHMRYRGATDVLHSFLLHYGLLIGVDI